MNKRLSQRRLMSERSWKEKSTLRSETTITDCLWLSCYFFAGGQCDSLKARKVDVVSVSVALPRSRNRGADGQSSKQHASSQLSQLQLGSSPSASGQSARERSARGNEPVIVRRNRSTGSPRKEMNASPPAHAPQLNKSAGVRLIGVKK